MGTFLDLFHQVSVPTGSTTMDFPDGKAIQTSEIDGKTVDELWSKMEDIAMRTVLASGYIVSDHLGTGSVTEHLVNRLRNYLRHPPGNHPSGDVTHIVLPQFVSIFPPHGASVSVMTPQQKTESFIYITDELGTKLPTSDNNFLVAMNLHDKPLKMAIASDIKHDDDKFTIRVGFGCLAPHNILIGSF